jgi:nicotinamidase-related amidase
MDNRYAKDRTALLFVDPYNDFLSEGGKEEAAS